MAGLGSSLYIGQSGLLANQAALQAVGNNLANLATPGYHKQDVQLATNRSSMLKRGVFVGTGVHIASVTRRVDLALEDRIRGSIGDQAASSARNDILKQIEALENEFSDIDISSRLNKFFNSWSNLSSNPGDRSLRQVVISEATTLTSFIQGLREDMNKLRLQVDDTIEQAAANADDLLTRIEEINTQIAISEAGSGGEHGLRDQRDQLLEQLAQYMDISVHERNSGAVDVFVGSLPVVLNGVSRGVELKKTAINGELQINMVIKDDQSPLSIGSGSIGAMVQSRDDDVSNAIDTLDDFTSNLIYEVNKLHSQGIGRKKENDSVGFQSVTGTYRVGDPTRAFNDSLVGMKFQPTNGTVTIALRQKSTNEVTNFDVPIDLDGIGTDTSLNSLSAAIDALDANISSSVTADGTLQISSGGSDFEILFGEDTSGVMAALGINTFFTGEDAVDVAVNSTVINDVDLIATGQIPASGNFDTGSNEIALQIDQLRDADIATLGGLSLTELWNKHVEDYSTRQGQSKNQLDADTIVRENLQNQRQAVSGVNADEEAVNLLSYQRAYQGSARFLQVVDELMETLINLA